MLDDILTSSVFTLIAAGVVAVVFASLQPVSHVEPGMTRELAAPSVAKSGEQMAATSDSSQTTLQLPMVVVTGHRLKASDAQQLAAND